MNKVALVIIYNHQFNKNIEILNRLYEERFSNIFHLVPFYTGSKQNVIAVYDSSYYFQGYVAQGLKSYFNEAYEHYFFIGDDLILNPLINEGNYKQHLKLSNQSSFIPRLSSIDENKSFWPNNITALLYKKQSVGVEAQHQLPAFDEALQKLKNFGIENKPLKFYQLWQTPETFTDWAKRLFTNPKFVARFVRNQLIQKQYKLSYPLVRSYSDLFVVSRDTIKEFCHYCGVFSSTRLFVELGLPTAMVLSAKEIVTEKDIQFQGRALWTKADYSILDQYEYNLQKLINNFPENYLYIHPVKLSKWKNKL